MPSPGLIDRDHLDAQTFGDAELAREVLALFAAQCRALVPALSETGADCADAAHTLRGAALGVGAHAVARSCAAFEETLRAGRPGDAGEVAAIIAATLAEIGDLGDGAA